MLTIAKIVLAIFFPVTHFYQYCRANRNHSIFILLVLRKRQKLLTYFYAYLSTLIRLKFAVISHLETFDKELTH